MKNFFKERSKVLFSGIIILLLLTAYMFPGIINIFFNLPEINTNNLFDASSADLFTYFLGVNLIIVVTLMITAATTAAVIGFLYKKKSWIMCSIIILSLFSLLMTATEIGSIIASLANINILVAIVSIILITIVLFIPSIIMIIGYINQNKIEKKENKKETLKTKKFDNLFSLIILCILFIIVTIEMIYTFVGTPDYIASLTSLELLFLIFGDLLILILLSFPITMLLYLRKKK